MTEISERFSPAYRNTLKLILAEQIPLGLLAVLITAHAVSTIFLYALISFWAGFAMIVVRRPKNPTKTDMFLIKWGTFMLFFISFPVAIVIWRWRGVI